MLKKTGVESKKVVFVDCPKGICTVVLEHSGCYKYKAEVYQNGEQTGKYVLSGYCCQFGNWGPEVALRVIQDLYGNDGECEVIEIQGKEVE